MTPGVSYISHGGGGGFSVGVEFSSGVYLTSHFHGRRRRRDNAGYRAGCCCAICYLVRFLLCLMDMKQRTRIILIWLFCFLGAFLAGGLIGRHYSPVDLSASPTEMRKVDIISPIFCQSVLVDSSSRITTYKFKSEPKINDTSSMKYVKNVTTTLKVHRYEYWGFYLLKGSVATVTVCPDNGMSLYIFKGKKNLDAFFENSLCIECYERAYSVLYCFGPPPYAFTINASLSDHYYFLFANEGYNINEPGPSTAEIHFEFDRKVYDFDGSSIVCLDEFHCDVSIPLEGSTSVVINVPGDSSLDTSITIFCRPRVYIYVILAIFPFVYGIALIIIRSSKKRSQQRTRSISQIFAVSNGKQLYGYTDGSYQIKVNPLSYAEAPPSYAEAPHSHEALTQDGWHKF